MTIDEIKNEKNWFRKCLSILSYHKSQQEQYDNVRGSKWKVSDTANALDCSVGYVSESIKLAKAIGKTPELEKLTRENALKALRERE